MKNVIIGILSGIVIFVVTFLLFNRLEYTNLTYSIMVALNFGIFFGLFTGITIHEIFINKLRQERNIATGVYNGIIIAIIMFAVIFGVKLCGDFSTTELFKLKFLILSIGFMTLSYGFLSRYIFNKTK